MILNLNTILFLTPLLSTAFSICEKFTIPSYPSTVSGIRLKNQVYTKTTETNLFQCAARCLNQRVCKSINYDISSRKCELNKKAEGDFQSTNFEQKENFTYSNISAWDSGIQGICKDNECKDEETCITELTNSWYTTKCEKSVSPVIPGCQVPTGFIRETDDIQFSEVGCLRSPGAHSVFPAYKDFRPAIDWSNMTKTILDCAQHVKSLGYSAFAIEYYGECWYGMYENANIDHGYVDDQGSCSTDCWEGVGKGGVAFLYRFI